MSSPQGRTGTILGVTKSPDGRLFYIKQNPNETITDIEYRIYARAGEKLGLQYQIPEVVQTDDPTILAVEDVGESLENILHTPGELQQTREQFTSFLTQNLQVRGALNTVINETLTVDDQQFLMEYNRAKLLASMKKIAPDAVMITPQDLEQHFWAYRVMNAVGVFDEQFKQMYTQLIGSKIDEMLAQRGGTWLQDNCLRNNATPDGQVLIPFDFNSLQYGLPQMDETGLTGLYLFNGILGVYDTREEREAFIEQRAKATGENTEEYKLGYILSIIHQNALLAGYRTQEARLNCDELLEQKKRLGGYVRETHQAFRKAHDEIEYQHSACIEALRPWNGIVSLLVKEEDDWKKIQYIDSFITHHTFGQRLGMAMRVMR